MLVVSSPKLANVIRLNKRQTNQPNISPLLYEVKI
jgi:hypothetical protein